MMKVITLEQSKLIGGEIYAQACVLDDTADQYQQPCDIIAERLRRLSEKRFAVVCRGHATMLDGETHALIRETSRSSGASNSAGIQQNANGSLDFFFGPRAPAGKDSNWVPTNGRDFEILFRLYGPEKAFFDKTWILPDVDEVK